MQLSFIKMHGLGNDFIVFDGRGLGDQPYASMAVSLCNRYTGIGADGLLIALNSHMADIQMRIINSDGSEAEMCGNGIRCFAKYVYETGIVQKQSMTVETLGGIMAPTLSVENGMVSTVCVDMGTPRLNSSDIPVLGSGRCVNRELNVLGKRIRFTSLLLGVPHTIVFVDSLDQLDIAAFGSAIEHADVFPKRTNVNFVHVLDDHTVEMRTWERGCGRTLACGTGASSTAVACVLNGKTGRSVEIKLQLGSLHIHWADNDHVYMTGPAAEAFRGTVTL